MTDAYPGRLFPVVSTPAKDEACVLCLQPLGAEASSRLKRFESFVGGAIAKAADEAEARIKTMIDATPKLGSFAEADWDARLNQITERDKVLGEALATFKSAIGERRELIQRLLEGDKEAEVSSAPAEPEPLSDELAALAEAIAKEADAAKAAHDDFKRAKLVAEHAELEDRKVLSLNAATLKKRRDLLKEDELYAAALTEVATTGITKRANELVDEHLTKVVLDQYDAERKGLEVSHLKVGMERKSSKTSASFQTNPGTAVTKLASDIFSEGEQRALALAAFFTEVAVTDGSGPIVIDDPVSSLDRQRGLKVASRLVAEAKNRQVIVFTHDLVFFNDVCREADTAGVANDSIALFADATNAGKIDPAGVIFKGMNVDRRLNLIKNEAITVKKLHAISPAAYEYQMKGLYGRLRDTYERAVEEVIFHDIVQRGSDRIETMKLRYVHLSDALAIRFHDGMTKANTHSHDNPAAETVQTPEPAEFDADIVDFEKLVAELKAEQKAAEKNRPSMKPK